MKNKLHRLSTKISKFSGSSAASLLAIGGVLVWVISGPLYNFSNTWLLVMSTLTDVVIFIMVFIVQNAQNRDSKAIQLKLDELIVADKKARDTFIGLENLTDDELDVLDKEFKELLQTLEPEHAMHKLHQKIAAEKGHRFKLAGQAGHLVGEFLSPILDNRGQDSRDH